MLWTDLRELWPHLVGAATLLLMIGAAGHAVMYKRDSRSAIAWVGIIWLVPLLGSLLYILLGINRVQRKAIRYRGALPRGRNLPVGATLSETMGAVATHLLTLDKLVHKITSRPLLPGNRVDVLRGGEVAYPAMIEAIDAARHTLSLSTYIFDNDRAGHMFVEALGRAAQRKVDVRVIVDDIGARYRWPSIARSLKKAGVPLARFLPSLFPIWLPYANLRSHRKLLVADGVVGFTGGLNIREGHSAKFCPQQTIKDMHFRLQGPVVSHLQATFAEDWFFCTGKELVGPHWFPRLEPQGDVFARGISSGPDKDYEKLHLALLGALACAETSVSIVTPYFLPDAPLITALNIAALRGVEVDIILPGENNLSLVKWASTAQLWQLLERGCRVWMSPPPFDHAKLMVVDRAWTLIGSANWDPRSLRLNFEFDVECYDLHLAAQVQQTIDERRAAASQVTLADVDGRHLPARLRDGVARLLTPYL